MAFLTILVADALSPDLHRAAVRAGPRAVAARAPMVDLLRPAGFVDVVETDVTDDYVRTAAAWVAESDLRRDELRAHDPAAYDQRVADRRAAVEGINAGLLRRSLLVGVRPA